jgi:hypothetical protein
VDLEQFYEADPRRRHSAELEFGRDWSDAVGRCEVSWVEATGEVYAMREPDATVVGDAFGDMKVTGVSDAQLVIEVLGIVAGRDGIEAVMSGWEDAMPGANSLEWVRGRVANAANERDDPPAKPSYGLPPH